VDHVFDFVGLKAVAEQGLAMLGVGGGLYAGGFAYISRGGQKARYTSGFSSNKDKRTTTPSTMLALTLRSSGVHEE